MVDKSASQFCKDLEVNPISRVEGDGVIQVFQAQN